MITTKKHSITLTSSFIATPLGSMIAIADEKGLYFLDFTDRKKFDHKIEQLKAKVSSIIQEGRNPIIDLITQELNSYFAGTLQKFSTPLHLVGSPFQQNAWNFLTTVPYGHTSTYAQEAITIGNQKACRAVAHANSKNNLAIIIPCHRIIASSGKLCGYAGGIDRKAWLIKHEQQNLR